MISVWLAPNTVAARLFAEPAPFSWTDTHPARACQTTIADAAGRNIVTIEGVSGKVADVVQTTWTKLDVPQCGYCQSGQVVATIALLTANRKPTDSDIDDALSGNLCRCSTYHRIRAAVHEAAKLLET